MEDKPEIRTMRFVMLKAVRDVVRLALRRAKEVAELDDTADTDNRALELLAADFLSCYGYPKDPESER